MDLLALDGSGAYKINISLCSNYKEVLGDIITIPDMHLFNVDAETAVFLRDNGTRVMIAQKLSKLTIRAAYSIKRDGDDDILYPEFGEGPHLCKIFDVPEQLPIYLVHVFSRSGLDNYFNMFAYDGDSVRIPPLPNLDMDGYLCTGEIGYPDEGGMGTIEQRMACLEAWQNNSWNRDLFREEIEEQCHKFFRMSPDGDQLPATGDFSDLTEFSPFLGSDIIKLITEVL